MDEAEGAEGLDVDEECFDELDQAVLFVGEVFYLKPGQICGCCWENNFWAWRDVYRVGWWWRRGGGRTVTRSRARRPGSRSGTPFASKVTSIPPVLREKEDLRFPRNRAPPFRLPRSSLQPRRRLFPSYAHSNPRCRHRRHVGLSPEHRLLDVRQPRQDLYVLERRSPACVCRSSLPSGSILCCWRAW